MGDDDSLTLHRKGIAAMAKLMEQKAKLNLNNEYYFPKSDEEVLREQHPALKDAWDKYQSILRLVKTNG